MLRRTTAALACLLVTATACTTTETTTGTPTTTVTEPAEVDLAGLQSRWWTWAASTPLETNPVADPTGEFCADNQPADVFFVAGSFGETVRRRCTVPAGQPIAGPAVNVFDDSRAGCEEFMRDASGEVELDGRPVELLRADPVGITIAGAPDNAVTRVEGTVSTNGCGLWFTLPGLDAGEHTLVIRGGSAGFEVEATYDLTATAAT
jgi:hypothetical protein